MTSNKGMISYRKGDVIQALRDINTMVVSLDRLGSSCAGLEREAWDRALAKFVEEWDVYRKMARIRTVLSEPFSDEIGEDGMDELEREMQAIPYWSPLSPEPPA